LSAQAEFQRDPAPIAPAASAAPAVHGTGTPAQALLGGSILRTLLRLAAPNVLATSMAVLVGLAETFYIGVLGVVPLAALGLVFPFAMLTGMLSAGAMGGGVSSALSRAFGAGDMSRAQSVALHALLIGVLGGVLYSLLFLSVAAPLFRLLGGRDAVLREALAYATVLFSGALAVWLFNTLASILRGTGNMRVPSMALIGAALLQISLAGMLGLGFGAVPRLGMPGVALGQILAQACGAIVLFCYLRSGRGRLRLVFRAVRIRGALFGDILKVGAVACLSPLQSVTTMLLMAGFVAQLGVLPLAGYAIGQRLEFLMSTVAFGIGLASVPMVGMAIGAGQVERARRVAWTAASVTATVLGAIGLLVALFPDLWADIFTRDEQVLDYCRQFLRWSGPGFGFFGFGLTLYFASQGAGRMAGPVFAATMRLLLVAVVGSWLVARGASAWQLFALSAAAMVVYGLTCAGALKLDRWGKAR
jgi:putative MATE family efflux protein